MARIAPVAAVLLWGSHAFAAPQPHLYDKIRPDLAKAAIAYDEAQLKGDGAALNRLLADDYVLFNGAGKVETKAQFIADSIDPQFRLKPFTVTEPMHIVWQTGAVLGGRVDLHFVDHGKEGHQDFRFTDVWVHRGDGWQVVTTAVTRIP